MHSANRAFTTSAHVVTGRTIPSSARILTSQAARTTCPSKLHGRCGKKERRLGKLMKIKIPELSLVVLIGVSGSGKSTFAWQHFKPTEVLSSDFCRALVSDDENSQA